MSSARKCHVRCTCQIGGKAGDVTGHKSCKAWPHEKSGHFCRCFKQTGMLVSGGIPAAAEIIWDVRTSVARANSPSIPLWFCLRFAGRASRNEAVNY